MCACSTNKPHTFTEASLCYSQCFPCLYCPFIINEAFSQIYFPLLYLKEYVNLMARKAEVGRRRGKLVLHIGADTIQGRIHVYKAQTCITLLPKQTKNISKRSVKAEMKFCCTALALKSQTYYINVFSTVADLAIGLHLYD